MNEKECRAIYREAFCDPDTEFENRLFSLCGKYCRTFLCGGKTAAMLLALPCEIFTQREKIKAFYIYAAATKRIYRGCGYMSRLINSLKDEDIPLFLKPADDGLTAFYERLGFKTFSASTFEIKNACRAVPTGGFKALAGTEKTHQNYEYTAMYYYKKSLELDNMYFPYIMD